MGLCDTLNQNYDNYFYDTANNLEKESIELGKNKEYLKSWGLSFCARVPYIADVIVNIVTIPLYLLGCIFGLIPTILTWGDETSLLSTCGVKFLEKFNHFWISLFGAVISPWVAHQFRDANIAFGGLIVLGAVGNEINKRTVFAINLN